MLLEVVVGLETEHELAPVLGLQADLDLHTQLLPQFVLDTNHVTGLLRPALAASAAVRGAGFVLGGQLFDIGLGGVDRQAAGDNFLADADLPGRVRDALEDLGVSDAQRSVANGLLQFGRQLQERHEVGDGRPAQTEPRGQLLVGHLVVGQVLLEPLRLLDRVEVGPLNVLHQGRLEALLIVEVHDGDRDRGHADGLGGPQPSLAGDQLIAIPDLPDEQRLQDAVVADALAQRRQVVVVERLAGLVRVLLDGFDGDLAPGRGRCGGRRLVRQHSAARPVLVPGAASSRRSLRLPPLSRPRPVGLVSREGFYQPLSLGNNGGCGGAGGMFRAERWRRMFHVEPPGA